ncbi:MULTISPECIES: SRPBCC domain-containing protein [Acidianus]|uniref:Carbon monoxide dehydrogenase n=1 Tax=Candidatus Acidianus copahuensis TaxID=1160895 RepID=A0A031LTK4_9CREN|nr:MULTISPECIES: SRPBCC domain-containing protein [Acidianus]EZQ10839.1 carbon monoxide dehydrogenase [Candidatus Acidianus copahuensis]NON61228.1 carbon monoxide dehydrogenase [Acidianus sp. RZ1]
MSKLSGTEKNPANKEKALQFFSNYVNLLKCTPGIEEINGKNFTVHASIGPLKVELEGTVKEHSIADDNVINKMEILGPGIKVNLTTNVKVEEKEIKWTAEYEISGSLSKALEKTISSQAEDITKKIISCTIAGIDRANNS